MSPKSGQGSRSLSRFRGWRVVLGTIVLTCQLAGGVALGQSDAPKSPPMIIRVDRIYVGTGEVIEDASILVRDGRIVAIGPNLEIPEGCEVVEVRGGVATPGLIDANARVESKRVLPLSSRSIPKRKTSGPDLSTIHRAGWLPGSARPDALNTELGEATPPAGHDDHDHAEHDEQGHDDHDHDDEHEHEQDEFHDEDSGLVEGGDPTDWEDPEHEGHDHTLIIKNPDFDNTIGGDYAELENLIDDCCVPEDTFVPGMGTFKGSPSAPATAPGVGPGFVVTDQLDEVVPHTRVFDSLNLEAVDFARLARSGVTTVYVSPDSSAVIGSRGAVVRTGGSDRVVREAGAVKATLGNDPIWIGNRNRSMFRARRATVFSRRPTTSMGVTWVFRKAFHDTLRRSAGLPVGGADTPSVDASRVLSQVLAGQVDLRIQARQQIDILSAFRLTREFGVRFTLEEATEAYLCLDELAAGDVPVIFGPIYERAPGFRAATGEARRSRYHTFRSLLGRGINTALSAQELRDEDGLARQCLYALRFGCDEQQVLRSVTETPARLLGIASETGTLAVGKRADLVVWNGAPFAATSKPALVLIGGERIVSSVRQSKVETW